MRCRACNAEELEILLDLGQMPLAGGFLDDASQIPGEMAYELVIHVCRNCCLVQIVESVDPDVLFRDYSFSASTVPGLVAHFTEYARWLNDRFSPDLVVEFGANDGVLIGPISDLGMRGVGVDRSHNITELARSRGHKVMTGSFTTALATEIRSEHGAADVVTGSNVFAHNADPAEILDATRVVLAVDGVLTLEVMYAGDLLQTLQWDTLYHEHLTFYALGTIRQLLDRHGFRVVDAERIPMHGGSLRVVATLDQSRPPSPGVDQILAWEASVGLDRIETWRQFAIDSRRSIEVVATTLERLARSASVWGY